MTTERRIYWGRNPIDLESGPDRRRRAIPMMALARLGWQATPGMIEPESADCVVLSGAEPGEDEIAWICAKRNVPIIFDAAAALARLGSDGLTANRPIAALANAVVTAGQEALPPWRLPQQTTPIPDPVETVDQYLRAKIHFAAGSGLPTLADPTDILWFAEPDDAGVADELRELCLLAPMLQRCRRHVTALVPSGLPDTWLSPLRRFGDTVRLAPWSTDLQFAHLRQARLLLLPGPPGAGGIAQARRARQALAHGIPVVGTSGADMDPLAAALILDDWERGLTQDPRTIAEGLATLDRSGQMPGTASIGQHWQRLLDRATQRETARPRAHRLMIFADLMQDIDLCLPLIAEAQATPGMAVEIVVSSWLAKESPRVGQSITAMGIDPIIVERKDVVAGIVPSLEGIDSVLTPVATTHRAHARAFALTERAKSLGIATFSMQHGLENIGLTNFDIPDEVADINTDYLLTWFPADAIPAQVPAGLRSRLAHVGCARPVPLGSEDFPRLPAGPRVGIFENLHWVRYTDGFRRDFCSALRYTARSFPETTFILKPHHGGQWITKNVKETWPANVIVTDPKDPVWEPHTAPSIICHVDAVITTPSTVALDAARAGRAIAVFGGDLDLPVFAPLPILRSTADWSVFCAEGRDHRQHLRDRETFIRRSIMPGVASRRAIEFIRNARQA